MKILLVDDDPDLLAVTGFALQQAGFLVVKAEDGLAALDAFEREKPHLAVLDINMPRMNGFDLAQKLRERSRIPLIMLTARSEESDVVRALALGADDYLSKPFSPKILIARVKALLRRAGAEANDAVAVGSLSLDVPELMLLGLARGPVRLTPLEARFLQLLFAHAGRTVSTDRLLIHVWGNRAGGNRQLLKQLVHRLRQKIEDDPADPRLVRNVPNAGYLLDPGCRAGRARRDARRAALISFRDPEFRRGFSDMVAPSLGIAAWGLVTGVAMVKSGLSVPAAVAMTVLVYAGSAQLAALPLIVAGAPLWVLWATAFCVNLRFVIYSAHWRRYFGHLPRWHRLVARCTSPSI